MPGLNQRCIYTNIDKFAPYSVNNCKGYRTKVAVEQGPGKSLLIHVTTYRGVAQATKSTTQLIKQQRYYRKLIS